MSLLNTGSMAISYIAETSAGQKVFIKQYKSPSAIVRWYQDYVEYQQELKRRLESTSAKGFTYRFFEFFEAGSGGKTLFQVFEYIEGGVTWEALSKRPGTTPTRWNGASA